MECVVCLGTGRCHICGGRARSLADGIVTLCQACSGRGRCAACSPAPAHRAPLRAAEVGTVPGSHWLHAARKTLGGNKAMCGAGSLTPHAGRFDPKAADSCPDCLAC